MNNISKTAGKARIYRRIHKWISIAFVFFLLVIGITAILLAWKKEWGLIPKTQTTKVESPSNWIPLENDSRILNKYLSSLGVDENSVEFSEIYGFDNGRFFFGWIFIAFLGLCIH